MSHVDFASLKKEEVSAPDGKPEFSIGSNKPLKCSIVACSRVIDGTAPFMIVSGGDNAFIAHLVCMGINPAANFRDPAYRAHLRDVTSHKLFGR